MKTKTYQKRTFLCGFEADSYIKEYIRTDAAKSGKNYRGKVKDYPPSWHAELKLADCYRSIAWSFFNEKKLLKTRKLLNDFFDRAEAACNEHKKALAAFKKEKNGRTRKVKR